MQHEIESLSISQLQYNMNLIIEPPSKSRKSLMRRPTLKSTRASTFNGVHGNGIFTYMWLTPPKFNIAPENGWLED